MDCYLDLHIQPDPEFPVPLLLNSLYAKLHRALVSNQSADIAVSFPKMSDRSLGDVLRLIGSRTSLDSLMHQPWLHGVLDHVSLGAITAVPPNARVRSLRREQSKSSPERLKRRSVKRLMQREGIAESEAALRVNLAAPRRLDLPYVVLKSASTGQTFRLFLKLEAHRDQPVRGAFNAYGLSQTATIPWF
jgi:CRISPR-associated endonuclease Csy4